MELNPMDKIQELTKKGRNFRNFSAFDLVPEDKTESGMFVEGVACVFDTPTVLFCMDGVEYKEVVDSRAFDGCDTTDVVFNYNHFGKVMARTRNKTLEIIVKPDGLHTKMKLDGTTEGRNLFEEVKGGYIDRMSFAFSVLEESYNQDTHTRTITKVKKLYDVAAVDIPAYDTTSLNARTMIDADAEIKAKLDSLTKQKRSRLKLLLEMESNNE